MLTSFRLLLRLAKVATVDSVYGRERLADALKARFRRYKPLRVANVQPVAPEIEAEAVLRYLGNLRRNRVMPHNYCRYFINTYPKGFSLLSVFFGQDPRSSKSEVKMGRMRSASYTLFPAVRVRIPL